MLEKTGEEIYILKSQLVKLTVGDEIFKKKMKILLELLVEWCKKGNNVKNEMVLIKEVRERREEKRKRLERRLERKKEIEKFLMEIIEEKIKEKEKEGEKEIKTEKEIAKKVIQIAQMNNRVKYTLPLDPSLPSFFSPFPISFSMSHFSSSFLPLYQGPSLFSLPLSSLSRFENYISFKGEMGGKKEKKEGKGKVKGSIRPKPFAKGAFRHSFFGLMNEGLVVGERGEKEKGKEGEKVVLKHMIDVWEGEGEGEGGKRGEIREVKECGVVHLVGRRVVEEFTKKGVKGCKIEMVKCEVLEWMNPTMVCIFIFILKKLFFWYFSFFFIF